MLPGLDLHGKQARCRSEQNSPGSRGWALDRDFRFLIHAHGKMVVQWLACLLVSYTITPQSHVACANFPALDRPRYPTMPFTIVPCKLDAGDEVV